MDTNYQGDLVGLVWVEAGGQGGSRERLRRVKHGGAVRDQGSGWGPLTTEGSPPGQAGSKPGLYTHYQLCDLSELFRLSVSRLPQIHDGTPLRREPPPRSL